VVTRLTNADTAKRALLAVLVAQTSAAMPLENVQVVYVDPAQDTEREAIFFGLTRAQQTWDQDFPMETASFPCYVQVVAPEDDPQVTEQRAVALGQIVRNTLLGNKLPAGPNSWWQITSTEMASGRDTDVSKTLLTLMVQVVSYL
jgi:hypothetical protein